MIIGLHSYSIGDSDKYSLSAVIPGILSHGLFTAAVPIFMFTSGYLFYKNTESIKDCLAKQKRRIVSLVLPFFAWSTLYYMVYFVGNTVLGIEMANNVVTSPLGILTNIVFYRYGFHLWYMFHLITYVICAPVIFLVVCKKKLSIILLIVFTILSFLGWGSISIEIMGTTRDLFHMNFFTYYFCGCLMGKHQEILYAIKQGIKKISVSILCIMYFGFGILGGLVYDGYITTFNKRCIVPLIAISCWAFLFKLCDEKIVNKTFPNISPMIIYGSHQLIGVLLGMIIQNLNLPSLVNYFLGIILTVICCCIASRVIKFVKPIYWILSGNR